jgi:hypothetical protein
LLRELVKQWRPLLMLRVAGNRDAGDGADRDLHDALDDVDG